MLTPAALDDVRTALQAALDGSDVNDRAKLLELANRMIMDHVKFRASRGESLDRLDGPECRGLNPVMDAVMKYVDEHRAPKFGSPDDGKRLVQEQLPDGWFVADWRSTAGALVGLGCGRVLA